MQEFVTDTQDQICCICSSCESLVLAEYVSPPARQCCMCLQQDREAKAQERDGRVPDAPADVLDKVPLPPAGSLVRGEAKKAMKKGAAVDGAVDVVKDAPAPGVVVEEIKRKGHVRGASIKRAEAGAERSGGLLWMSHEPIRIPAPDAAPAGDATRSENRVRGAGKATHTCRVHGCDNDAMGKFVCPTHAGVVVHEEVAAGECAQQRYCRRCQGMKNAFGFKPDGACGEKCPLITAGRGDRRRKGPGYINRVLAGVAWPADAGAPSLQQCRDVAALMGVGLLHHDHGAAGGGCCHETQGGERCGAACVADQRVCAARWQSAWSTRARCGHARSATARSPSRPGGPGFAGPATLPPALGPAMPPTRPDRAQNLGAATCPTPTTTA